MPYEPIQPEKLKLTLDLIRERIYVPLAELTVTAWVTPEPVSYEERTSGRRTALKTGDKWGDLWDCAWFHFAGSVPAGAAGKKIVLLIDINGELCLVDREGTPSQGLTNVNSEFDFTLGLPGKRVVHLSACADGSETVDLWGDAGCNDLFGKYRSGTLKEAVIAVCRESFRQLYYDMEVLLELAEQLPAASARRTQVLQALYEVSRLMAAPTEERAVQSIAILAPQLAKQGGDPSLSVSAVGHAHIDLAWLWPIRETIRKGARTFATALRMMELYPDYVFGASQPQLYDWIKERYPKLYSQIKARVKEGRWEVQGAMWVEPDTNLSGGEALVRQILYGKRFFEREFGEEMKILWLPDVFGYSASLPQILKLSGVNYMMTQKLSWNMYNRHPHHTFWWEGLDGSRVLTHLPPEDTYNSPAAPRSIAKAEREYLDKNVSEHCLMLFGIGDGGGGPGEEHLERLSRERNLQGLAPVRQEPSIDFFHKLERGSDRYQAWRGELYLEKHQGTLTTQGRSKRYNRRMEKALRELEFACSMAHRFDISPYPAKEMESIWKEVLLYQFHDILPGSSITRVYTESLERYGVLLERVKRMTEAAYRALTAYIQPVEAATGEQAVVFNSLPWRREQWLRIGGRWASVAVPAMGYAVVDLAAQAGAAAPLTVPQLAAGRCALENDLLRLAFDPEDGSLVSVVDKRQGREVVAPGEKANVFSVYQDQGDAWDFMPDYRLTEPEPLKLVRYEAKLDGPQAVLSMIYAYGASTLEQQIVLTAGSPRIDFRTKADWQEPAKMLRVSFPLQLLADTAACDIQFGHIHRPTHRNTMWDYAKDEICAQQWIDLSQPDYGAAILNDGKYGHCARGHVLDLNLIRTPSYPDPDADRAVHEFTYSLLPHEGNYLDALVYRAGYELNVPLHIAKNSQRADVGPEPVLAPIHSFMDSGHAHVMIEAVKKCEDSGDLLLRLYETAGSAARTELRLGFPVRQAALNNLMEQHVEHLSIESYGGDAVIPLAFRPFEIKTIRILAQN